MIPSRQGWRGAAEPILVIICERDVDDPFRSCGAIVFEQYTSLSPEQVREQARMLANGGKYGKVWTANLYGFVEIEPKGSA